MLVGLPLASWWVARAAVPVNIRIAVPVGVVLLLAVMTFMRADLWSSPYLQALKWAQVNPESPRAQHNLAGFWWEVGNYSEAARLNGRAIALDPDGLAWLMTRVMYQCAQDEPPEAALAKVEAVLQAKGRMGSVGTYQTGKLLDYLMAGNCRRLSQPDALMAMLARLQQATKNDGGQFGQLLLQRRAALLLQQGQAQAAYRDLSELVAASGQPGAQLRGAAMLASAGHYQQALKLLDEGNVPQLEHGGLSMKRLRDKYLQRTHYYQRERTTLRETIRADLDTQQAPHED